MNCRSFERQAADWLGGRLPPDRSEGMAAHQKTCASCARIARTETQFRERWHEGLEADDDADLWPRLLPRLQAPEQGAMRTRKGGIRRPQWAVATAVALAAIGSYSVFTGSCLVNRAAPERGPAAQRASQAPAGRVSSEAAIQSHAGTWSALGDVSQTDPAVDDPVGTSMENVWTYLKTDGK